MRILRNSSKRSTRNSRSLNAQARDLEQTIAGNVAEILEA